jgi:hypothetical protein
MKQITLFILFLFLGVTSSMAQDEILDEIASQGCDCVEKLDLTGLNMSHPEFSAFFIDC